jgi:CubicO group peptidase (beta-lactamase class C family)
MSLIQNTLYKLSLPFLLLLMLSILFTVSCNSSYTADKITGDSLTILNPLPAGPVSAAERERIKNSCQLWYDSVLKPRGFSGGIIVAKEGNIIFEQYSGTGHIPGTDTITQNSPLHIASVSKTFTAMAVLKLWQDGKLNIDEEFSKYFPAFNYPGVTIRCLMNHRSGLPNYTHFLENLGWDKSRMATNEDVLDFLITRKAELTDITTPNSRFSYCNTNYALLALLIEKISGSKYADYMNQAFFIPLQMKNSYVFTLADTVKAIPSYNWRGKPEPLNFLDQVYGDKNIYTTPRDLLTWDRALSNNILFTNETLNQAYTPYSNERPGVRNYGLGWRMNIFPEGNKIIYHNGWWHGSNATFIRLLNEKATIIVIGNKFTRTIYHAKILASIFGNYYGPVDE